MEFLAWFIGFVDAEGCFKIKPKYRQNKDLVHSFYFEFEIHLHKDDVRVLEFIRDSLGFGRVYTRNNSSSFVVGSEDNIRALLNIFDQLELNGIKRLDYEDFKKAFLLYFNREGGLTEKIINIILNIKNNMNSNRSNFDLFKPINITSYYLLGLIEGDATFSFSRSPLRPNFQILFTCYQEPLLLKIKEFLIGNLGLDSNSLWYLRNSSVISINVLKAKDNAKATVLLEIRNVNLLVNYFLPFLSNLEFKSKKIFRFYGF